MAGKKAAVKERVVGNWKTSLAGLITLAGLGANVYGKVSGDPVASSMDWTQVAGMVSGAIGGAGLLAAKDK